MASPLPHVAGSATSADAAEAALPRAGTARRAVLSAIRAAGLAGLTDEQIQERLALEFGPNTARPRRVELSGRIRAGEPPPDWALIVAHGTRATRSGCAATVWVSREVLERSQAGAQLGRLEAVR